MTEWIAIVGTRTTGRVEAVEALSSALAESGLSLGGLSQELLSDDAGAHTGCEVVERATGRRTLVARASDDPDLCDWAFDDAAFAAVRRRALEEDADATAVPLGTLESREEGHWPLVQALLRRDDHRVLVLTLRPQVAASVALKLPDPMDGLELPAPADEVEAFARRVATAVADLRRTRRSPPPARS